MVALGIRCERSREQQQNEGDIYQGKFHSYFLFVSINSKIITNT